MIPLRGASVSLWPMNIASAFCSGPHKLAAKVAGGAGSQVNTSLEPEGLPAPCVRERSALGAVGVSFSRALTHRQSGDGNKVRF